jgi:hypothetical protein
MRKKANYRMGRVSPGMMQNAFNPAFFGTTNWSPIVNDL